MMMSKQIIGWYEYTTIENDVGINNEQYGTVKQTMSLYSRVKPKKMPKKNRRDRMKVLLYCTKAKPYLWYEQHYTDMLEQLHISNKSLNDIGLCDYDLLNGKVVASCDVNTIYKLVKHDYAEAYHKSDRCDPDVGFNWILDNTCLTNNELWDYGKGKDLYAWHIDNLQVFDEPIELRELYKADMNDDIGSVCWLLWSIQQEDADDSYINDLKEVLETRHVTRAPQSYQYVYYKGEKCLLLSVKSEYVEKILNGKKTIEIRKSVSKEVKK